MSAPVSAPDAICMQSHMIVDWAHYLETKSLSEVNQGGLTRLMEPQQRLMLSTQGMCNAKIHWWRRYNNDSAHTFVAYLWGYICLQDIAVIQSQILTNLN